MKIEEIKVLRGPNYWSVRRQKLIQMKLDLEEMEQRPTDKIEGFRERLETMIPSLIDHRCSEDKRGGFFQRVEEGTWMGHVIEHIALEIQTLAGMDTGFGRTRRSVLSAPRHSGHEVSQRRSRCRFRCLPPEQGGSLLDLCRLLHDRQLLTERGSISGIREQGNYPGIGDQLGQEFEPLWRQLADLIECTGDIAAWPRKTDHEAIPNRIAAG